MGSIIINQVIYKGDTYFYSSPILSNGLQIIEGENGSGKTTFSSLICYGLGMYVKQFDKRNKDYHDEICADSNNYVILKIKLSGIDYEVKRYFSEKNNNIVFVTGEVTENFFINRNSLSNKEDLIFSDWLLNKLGIKVFEIFQGTKKFKINFSDLFRLIHYDQYTMPLKIYKEHRSDNNFISDSVLIRKVIFEILMGYSFSDYYYKMGTLKQIESERNTIKSSIDVYKSLHGISEETKEKELNDLESEISKLKIQLEKVYLERKSINTMKVDVSGSDSKLQKYRLELFELENTLMNLLKQKESLLLELNNLKDVKESLILEVTYIQKIIHANKELGIFSSNKCPCCFKEVTRVDDRCICGNEIESHINNFFYSTEEYLNILKSKQKAVETIDIAIKSVINEITLNKRKGMDLNSKREAFLDLINGMKSEIKQLSRTAEVDKLNDKILEIRSLLQTKEQLKTVLEKLDIITTSYNRKNSEYERTKAQINKLGEYLTVSMNKIVTEFEKVYLELIQSIDSSVRSFELDDTFMPIINDGIYAQASSNVVRRIIYFLTMLYLSMINKSTSYPKFILMDTPENLGIDEKNLINSLLAIDKILEVNESEDADFQIILTTGIKKYPEKYQKYVVDTLTEESKLLKLV